MEGNVSKLNKDQRIYEAACEGDVEALLELLEEDRLILFTATLSTSYTPLHIAALLGHNEFAKLTMTRNPKLSKEFDCHGYSPIHLASLKGHLQIVKDLLNIDKELCVLRDNCEGRTALHCAAIKGRIDVIGHLLSCRPESAKELTFKGETLLHLVVKNSQGVRIMKPLISILGELNLVGDLINCADEDGNTVLHLATYTNQFQIIKVLLRDTNVNINAVNAVGYNASAISDMNNINASSSEIDIREMNSQAQSLQRGGSSDQQAAGVPIITASNGRRNEEQQHQIVDVDSSHGAGDHSSDNNSSAISEMNNINASSSEFGIREMNSRAQSLRRDQPAAGVPIITASNGRRNEEQQQQIVDVDSSHGAGDHSSDKANDDDKELADSTKSGILLMCSFFAAFCLGAILNLPGGIKPGQLQSKPMNITVGQLKKLQSFLFYDVWCFFLSVTTILLVTFASSFNYKYSIRLNSFMMGALISAATILFYTGLVLATNDRLARAAFEVEFGAFSVFMAITYIFVINKKSRSFIRKEWSKIRDLIT